MAGIVVDVGLRRNGGEGQKGGWRALSEPRFVSSRAAPRLGARYGPHRAACAPPRRVLAPCAAPPAIGARAGRTDRQRARALAARADAELSRRGARTRRRRWPGTRFGARARTQQLFDGAVSESVEQGAHDAARWTCARVRCPNRKSTRMRTRAI
jgi:hypothetical protein